MNTYNYQPLYDILFCRVPRPIGQKIRKDGNYYLATSATKGDIISLNRLAGEICASCDGKKSIGDIYNDLSKQYNETDKYQLASDLCRCISDLETFGMITVIHR